MKVKEEEKEELQKKKCLVQTRESPGVLTISTNHPGGNLGHKHKTVKFDVVGEQPTTKYYPNQLKTD